MKKEMNAEELAQICGGNSEAKYSITCQSRDGKTTVTKVLKGQEAADFYNEHTAVGDHCMLKEA